MNFIFSGFKIEFTRTLAGGVCLIYNGQRFLKHSKNKNIICWKCGVKRTLNCTARIKQNIVTNTFNLDKASLHNHEIKD